MKGFEEIINFKGVRIIIGLTICGFLFLVPNGCSNSSYNSPNLHITPDAGSHQAKIYFMNQKKFTIGEQFTISDENGKLLFSVLGKPFTFGDKLKIFDSQGIELIFIKQKLFSLKNLYKIYRNNNILATVVRKLTLFKDNFLVDIPGQSTYVVRGNFPRHKYYFARDGKNVAFISKKWFSFGDKYRIEIGSGENELVILAAVVIIDMVSHNDHDHVHSYNSSY